MYTNNSTIDKHLSAQTYGELSAYCKANGIPLESLRQLKPSMLMITLTFAELTKLGVTQRGVDSFFYEKAQQDNKAIEGLETVDKQIDYIASMADGAKETFVTHTIRDMKSLPEQFDSLARAWRQGDVDKLDELVNAELKTKYPSLYRRLITDRNRNWLTRIDTYQSSRL